MEDLKKLLKLCTSGCGKEILSQLSKKEMTQKELRQATGKNQSELSVKLKRMRNAELIEHITDTQTSPFRLTFIGTSLLKRIYDLDSERRTKISQISEEVNNLKLDNGVISTQDFTHSCVRCDNVWQSGMEFPKACPKCKQYNWDQMSKKASMEAEENMLLQFLRDLNGVNIRTFSEETATQALHKPVEEIQSLIKGCLARGWASRVNGLDGVYTNNIKVQ